MSENSVATLGECFASGMVLCALLTGCATVSRPQSPQVMVAGKFATAGRDAIADIENLYAVDAVMTSTDFCAPCRGRREIRRNEENLFNTFPAITADVLEYIVQGDRVALRLFDALVREQIVKGTKPFRDWPFQRVDYVFVRLGAHGGRAFDILNCERILHEQQNGTWASDHFGLVADLAMPSLSDAESSTALQVM